MGSPIVTIDLHGLFRDEAIKKIDIDTKGENNE